MVLTLQRLGILSSTPLPPSGVLQWLPECCPGKGPDALPGADKLRPVYPLALTILGNVLQELGRLDEAQACFHQAKQPDLAGPHAALAGLLEEARRLGGRWKN